MGSVAKKTLILTREESDMMGTLGRLTGAGLPAGGLTTLELPWRNNKNQVSCIPTGRYEVGPYLSPSKGFVYLLDFVSGRTYIEIHVGNVIQDLKGCIAIGMGRGGYPEKDSYFIKNSRIAFNILKSVVGDKNKWSLLIQNSKELEMKLRGVFTSPLT